eukprot:166113-Amorphochlora_amoeboformis.AAC.1
MRVYICIRSLLPAISLKLPNGLVLTFVSSPVFKCLESRVVNSIPNIRSDGTQKSTAFARLGFGIGFGFFGDGGGTDLDDLNGEEEAMYEVAMMCV